VVSINLLLEREFVVNRVGALGGSRDPDRVRKQPPNSHWERTLVQRAESSELTQSYPPPFSGWQLVADCGPFALVTN
jgi:hypothetical protein